MSDQYVDRAYISRADNARISSVQRRMRAYDDERRNAIRYGCYLAACSGHTGFMGRLYLSIKKIKNFLIVKR